MNTTRTVLRTLTTLALAFLAASARGISNAQAQQAAQRNRVVIQVSDADPGNGTSRSTTRKTSRPISAPPTSISKSSPTAPVSACSLDSTVGGRVDEATAAGVKVVACENTMKGQKLTRADMLNGIGYVPAGVVELMSRQQQGWAYVRP
jgi:predicted peroxiredoxin